VHVPCAQIVNVKIIQCFYASLVELLSDSKKGNRLKRWHNTEAFKPSPSNKNKLFNNGMALLCENKLEIVMSM
jgi:hypothetical protein